MNKSKFKFFGFSFLFALMLLFSVDMNAQADANALGFSSIPVGTFETEASFQILNTEMDNMPKGQTVTAEYRYYWLVAVDIKRNNIPVEESLINQLGAISEEFSYSTSDLETLYQNTVDKL